MLKLLSRGGSTVKIAVDPPQHPPLPPLPIFSYQWLKNKGVEVEDNCFSPPLDFVLVSSLTAHISNTDSATFVPSRCVAIARKAKKTCVISVTKRQELADAPNAKPSQQED